MHSYLKAQHSQRIYPSELIASAFLVFTLWTASTPACAITTEEKPVAAQIAALRPHLAKAVLYIGTRRTTYNVPRKESDLPGISCEYILTDPKSLSALMDILDRGTFVNVSPPKITDVRVGIYLYERNGNVSKIFLNAPFIGEGVKGRYNDQIGVIANLTFDKELRDFASTLKQTKPSYECDSEKGIR